MEQDPSELWSSVEPAAAAALADAGLAAGDLAAIGITNQRETTVVWDRRSGEPVYPAIVWQDRRTAERCRELPAEEIRARTGLTVDPYFSATKLEWILDVRPVHGTGSAFGTVDTWLAWRLTAGGVHVTDASNASRTMLLDLESLAWSDELLRLFGVDRSLLPEVRRSAEVVGEGELLGATLPIAGLRATSRRRCTGMRASSRARRRRPRDRGLRARGHGRRLLGSAARPRDDRGGERGGGPAAYALEGSVFVAGAAVQWLRDGLGVLADAAESEALARAVPSTEGVYFVPALTGLGSPHWAPDARGLVCGITRGTRREHLVRAALESIAFQLLDVVDGMPERPASLRLDGGAAGNAFVVQFVADVLQLPVEVAAERETTALGAAALAGVAVGRWSEAELSALRRAPVRCEPQRSAAEMEPLVAGWHDAVRRTLH